MTTVRTVTAVATVWVLGGLTIRPAAAQDVDFSWKGRVAAGKTVEIKNVNGDITARAAAGDQIEVAAVKRARKSDPDEVEIRVVEHQDGVTICAVYPTPRRARHENSCEPGDGGHMSTDDNDVAVHFTVRVPARVTLDAGTVNGEIDADGLQGDVVAATVNGGVTIATSGIAEARTVNGSIRATLGRADFRHAEFTTVNGGITLDLPADLAAEVRAETLNGGIDTDFPLSVSGRFSARRLVGTIGTGATSGRTLYLKTVNGSLRLRKR